MVHLTWEQNCLQLFQFTELMIPVTLRREMYGLKQDWLRKSGITEINDSCYEVQ